MSELFKLKETKNELRRGIKLNSNIPRTTTYGIDSVSYLAPNIWDQILTEIKNCITLHMFKRLIKTWTPISCPCRHCKGDVFNVGYI